MTWSSILRHTRLVLGTTSALCLATFLGASCARSDAIDDLPTGGSTGTGDPPVGDACILRNCNSDAECGGCSEGRHTCLLSERRCVACDGVTGEGCAEGEYCSSYGDCVPNGTVCPTDDHGTPTITCTSNIDCVACDPMHQICDPDTSRCVACTEADTSSCQSTDICINNDCSPLCPAGCSTDNDCMYCGGQGSPAHACNAHKCAECSPTYACKAGMLCSPQGVCVPKCGQDGQGACASDADCTQCGESTKCHLPLNGPGVCGPPATGCSDLGNGVAVLPPPWDQVTNTCSNNEDCAGVGATLNVGKLLRDITGISSINDANIQYPMKQCAAITLGSGNTSVSCGLCVPCKVDSDCVDIDVDKVALQAFGPIGSIAAAILLDQVFGPNDHIVHMYCKQVSSGYGVCAPCPGVFYDCGVGTTPGGGTGTCHDECTSGGSMASSCSACAQAVCNVDSYCCNTAWDSQCVNEVNQYCSGKTCGGGGTSCAHGVCTAGDKLDPTCSSCVQQVCMADTYCCDTAWDSTCVGEVETYCGTKC